MKRNGEAEACQCSAFPAICLVVSVRALQMFLSLAAALLVPVTLVRGALSMGTTYSISFVDIDGNKLSTGDGHVTIGVKTRLPIANRHAPWATVFLIFVWAIRPTE